MVKIEKYSDRDMLPYRLHRLLGKSLFATDIDMIEYRYKDKDLVISAIIDYKDPDKCKDLSFKEDSVKLQSFMATKLGVPFFLVLTYLGNNYDVPMMYVIAYNDIAKEFMKEAEASPNGEWCSMVEYSEFLHCVRKIPHDTEAQAKLTNNKKVYKLPGEKNEIPNIANVNFITMHLVETNTSAGKHA